MTMQLFTTCKRRFLFCAALLLGAVALGGCAGSKPPEGPKEFAFWPAAPDEPRIQFLFSFTNSSDIEAPLSGLDQLVLGKETHEVLPVSKPYGARMYQGRVYVCDVTSHSVKVYDLKKRESRELPNKQAAMQTPLDIAITPDGLKYVADLGRGMVHVFDQNDKFVTSLGHKDFKPMSVAVYENDLAVVDFQNQRIEILNRTTGQTLRTVGVPGGSAGQFVKPLGLAYDGSGNFYVSDTIRCNVQKFTREGKFLLSWGEPLTGAGNFIRPKHVAVDRAGYVYVVDAAFQNVQVFTNTGQLLTFFGSYGGHPGAMYLPVGVSVDEGDLDVFKQYIHPAFNAERLIIVTNQFGPNKVSVYALGQLKPGKTLADIAPGRKTVPMESATQPAGSTSLPSEPAPTTSP